jgi:DNA repair protein RadD
VNADRPYQVRAKGAVREAMRGGARSVCLVSPTGSGKTVMLADMVRDHLARADANRANWCAHRIELERQAADTLRAMGLEVGCRGEGRRARVQVVGTQRAVMAGELPDSTLTVLDEAHHYASDRWSELALAARRTGWMLGGTATPERGDGRGLHHLFDALVTAAQPRELMAEGHLVPCEVLRPRRVLKPDEIAQRPVDAYRQHSDGLRVIVFAPHVKASEEYAAEFRAAGVMCETVADDTPAYLRKRRLDQFAEGRIRVLVNCYVLTEGYDCPALDGVIIARGCGTPGMFIQIAGRALRTSPGKVRGLVLDLRGVSHMHGTPDEDRTYSLDGIGIRRAADAGVRFCEQCGATLGDTGVCPQCSRAGTKALVTPHATGDELERFAAKRQESQDKRVSTLARWLVAGRAKGWKDSASFFRFRAVYGYWPAQSVIAEAERKVKGGEAA